MADDTTRRAPRVPPGPNSLAAAAAIIPAQAVLGEYERLILEADSIGDDDDAFAANSDARYQVLDRLASAPALSLNEYVRKCDLLFSRSLSFQQMPAAWSLGLIADAVRLFTAVRP